MVFDSLLFVLFFVATLLAFASVRSWSARKRVLLVASYLFYAAWNPFFVLLLLLSTVLDFELAWWIRRSRTPARRRALLLTSLAINLGLLGTFKYGAFLAENFARLAGRLGVDWSPPTDSWVLPVGISFYTLQTLSYTIDVYRGRLRPTRRFVDYALYVSFFPQLVAGPIVRAQALLPQWRRPRSLNADDLGWGGSLLLLGLFLKVVVSDGLAAPTTDAVYDSPYTPSPHHAWLGVIAFGVQIFGDFGGYSLCAIGAARCFGIHLPPNFLCPFSSVGFREFWRRWHVSLSTWLRDYVYIPLGGNRRGPWLRSAALLTTMLLAGLWHGAAWKFAAWGLLHGAIMCLETALWPRGSARLGPVLRAGGAALTFLALCVTLLLVRSPDFSRAATLGLALVGLADDPVGVLRSGRRLIPILAGVVVACHLLARDRSLEEMASRLRPAAYSGVLTAALIAICMVHGARHEFFYFQF